MVIYLFQNEPANGSFDLDVIWNSILGMVNALLYRLPYIVAGVIVFLVFLVIARLVNRAVNAAGERTRLDVTLANLLGRLASFVITVLGVLVAAVVVFPAFQPGDLIAGLGLTSVAVGFAFKDVLQNFFAGILILWRKPFVVGDQIKFREFDGTVEEINVRSTRIKTYDGERAVIPNGDIYTNAVLVRTAFDRRRASLAVGIGYQDSIEKARSAIMAVLERTEGVLKEPEPSANVVALAPSSVDLKVLFWTKSKKADVRLTSDRVATGIKLALDEAGIDMPYPHSVVLFHDKTGTRDGDIERVKYLSATTPRKPE
ncbi:MAG: mechanosensitive ion channel family protein [bacterium]|nr:mechanosensitive ion channel family protein [bacterium]